MSITDGNFLDHGIVNGSCAAFPKDFKRSMITTMAQALNWAVCGFHVCVDKGLKASGAAKTAWNNAAQAYHTAGVYAAYGNLTEMIVLISNADAAADAAKCAGRSTSGGVAGFFGGGGTIAEPDAGGDVSPPKTAGGNTWLYLGGAVVVWYLFSRLAVHPVERARVRRRRR